MQNLYIFITSLLCWVGNTKATDYKGCIGSSFSCGSRVELFPDDTVTLESSSQRYIPDDYWQSRVIIVRQTRESYDVCTGCKMNIKFVNASEPFTMKVTLMEANYSSDSFIASETLFLDPLFTYDGGVVSLNTTGTVLKLEFGDMSVRQNYLKIIVTPIIPATNVDIGLILGIVIPITVMFIVLNVVAYKLRQRRVARMRAALEARLSALVTDAALDAALLREARARRVPASPDPMDSVAPPSYEDAAAPPKYEDIVEQGCEMVSHPPESPPTSPPEVTGSPDAHPPTYDSETIDMAGPDNGQDVDMLIV